MNYSNRCFTLLFSQINIQEALAVILRGLIVFTVDRTICEKWKQMASHLLKLHIGKNFGDYKF